MAQQRVDELFASENWTTVYTAFTNVDLKSYDFDSIRESLLAYVSQTYPDKFNDFIASSEFIAILDLVAYLGHSLAFRTDLNSRENFLDTAERRESILRLAKTLGYNKSRPTNARGFLKITSVSTTQPISDSNGKSLANKKIFWNDSNNDDWYDDFATILNEALTTDSKIDDPAATLTQTSGENYLHYVNENPSSKSTRYSFTSDIASSKRKFDVVRAEFEDDMIIEGEPNRNQQLTIIARDDNLGPASDRTGFFVYAKAGELRFKDVDYTNKLTNRVERVADANISETDVWVQKLSDQGEYKKPVTIVDNTTRQNAIYNALRTGSNDLAAVTSLKDNNIQITFPDGIYGNAAYGRYRIWYRVADNADFTVNRDDIKNAQITIPYMAKDGRSYRLTMTLNCTLDFTENFAGENYYSVKRLAPKTYYTQDRMVNGQDYSVLPLTLGSNIVSKAKAVNTTFAGKSRFFEMDDVTGHHSTVSVSGTDGSVYFEDKENKIEFYINPQQADIDSFIRNELVKTIADSIVENQFYYLYRNNAQVKQDLTLETYTWESDPSNPSNLLKGVIENDDTEAASLDIRAGDYIKIGEYWYVVSEYDAPSITIDRPAMYGQNINEYVYGYDKTFTDDQVDTIKSIITDNATDTFYLAYDFPEGEGLGWSIRTENELTPTDLEEIIQKGLYVKVEYTSGIRRTESRFIATVIGKSIVFESRDQVKFFYSNNEEIVIDNETNKANNDAVFLNYHSGYVQEKGPSESEEYDLTLGFGPVVDVDEANSTFTISYAHSGADINYDYIETANPYITGVVYEHELVAPNGLTEPLSGPATGLPYQDQTYDLSEVGETATETVLVEEDILADETLENVVLGPFSPFHQESANAQSHISDYIDISKEYLINNGFVGDITLTRLSSLLDDGKLFFADESEITPETLDSVDLGDQGTQTPMVTTDDGLSFRFTFIQNDQFPLATQIMEDDIDIWLKQKAYCQITFISSETYSIDDIFIQKIDGNFVQHNCITLDTPTDTGSPNTYVVYFWCEDVRVGDLVDLYTGQPTALQPYIYHGRIKAKITQQTPSAMRTNSYNTIASLVSDNYVTNQGYVDYHKVLLNSKDIKGDPYALIDMISSTEIEITDTGTISEEKINYVVLEEYQEDFKNYFRVSSYAVAFEDDVTLNEDIPETAKLYYDVESNLWYYKTTLGWSLAEVNEIEPGNIIFQGVNYIVREGKTFVVDEYMSYRWDHYADKDRRIDPSTSNIIDVYLLSSDYVRRVNEWKDGGYKTIAPLPPTTYELNKLMENVNQKAAIADHVSYIPAKFKYLFGTFAEEENQAYFKVVKKAGTSYTDSEVKSKVAEKVNKYFDLNNWDFGETFYFSELAAYLHTELSDYIASVVITPKYSSYDFRNMLNITCEENEIFMSLISSENVKIIDRITNDDLMGEY